MIPQTFVFIFGVNWEGDWMGRGALGGGEDCANYKGISILSLPGKILWKGID